MNHYAFLDDILVVYTYTAYEYVLDENTIKEGKTNGTYNQPPTRTDIPYTSLFLAIAISLS